MTTLEKYIWVVNALYRAGSHGLSLKELSDKWKLDEANLFRVRPSTVGKTTYSCRLG